jgi:hypothetical protein
MIILKVKLFLSETLQNDLYSRETKILISGKPFVFKAVIFFINVRLVFFRIVERMTEYFVETNQIPRLIFLT